MPIHAVALLRIDPDALPAAKEASDDGWVVPTPRGPVRLVATGDAVHVHLGLPFDASPRELAQALQEALGAALDAHTDPRGVYVYPDIARTDASTYEAIVADLGEGGMWVRRPRPDASTGGTPDLFSAVQGLLGGDTMAKVQQALADPNGDAMASLAGLAGKLLEDPALRQTVESAASALLGGGAAPDLREAAPADLLTQAQSLAGRLSAERPDLVADLTRRMGLGEEE